MNGIAEIRRDVNNYFIKHEEVREYKGFPKTSELKLYVNDEVDLYSPDLKSYVITTLFLLVLFVTGFAAPYTNTNKVTKPVSIHKNK